MQAAGTGKQGQTGEQVQKAFRRFFFPFIFQQVVRSKTVVDSLKQKVRTMTVHGRDESKGGGRWLVSPEYRCWPAMHLVRGLLLQEKKQL